MAKPKLTKNRIILAFVVAVIADAIELPITGVELTGIGAPLGEGSDCVVDLIVMGVMTKLLGFHWMFLPTFVVEAIPVADMLPTWVGCVAFVVWQRKKEEKEQAQLPPLLSIADVHKNEPPAASGTPPPIQPV